MRERLVAMTTISELLRGAGFDQKTVEVICEAYIKARKSSRDTNHADLVNEIIARRKLILPSGASETRTSCAPRRSPNCQ
jgi:hypothetical protein